MIVSSEQLAELRRDKWTELVVDADPPTPGAMVWVRESVLEERPAAQAKVTDAYPIMAGGYAVQLELVEPDFTLPKKPPAPSGALTADQRRRLFDGNCAPLIFDREPGLENGDTYVLAWQPERTVADPSGCVVVFPRERLFWIEVTNVVRRIDEAWEVGFRVFDRRQPVRLMRRVPMLGTPEPEITSNPKAAIDRIDRDGPINWDGTNLLHLEEARQQHRDLHADRDREQETRSLTHRLRAARAQARERGVDDSPEVDAIRQWIDALERKLRAA